MNWIQEHRVSFFFVAVTLLVPLILYANVLFGVLGLGFEYAAERERIEPRLERLSGLQAKNAVILEQNTAAQAVLSATTYPSSQDDSELAAALQSSVRQIFLESGFSVSNSQVLPVKDDEDFKRVQVKLTVTGSLPSLDSALIGLAAHSPVLLIENLDTFPTRQSRRRSNTSQPQSLTAVVQVMALQARS
ncbi:MAG: type II secretion system protein GspM [Pseudomonadota bacterium]